MCCWFCFRSARTESLDSLPSPLGPAFGCYSFTLRIPLLAENVTKEKARALRVCCGKLPLAPAPLRRPGSAPPREESEKAGFAWLCFFAFLARPARRDQPPLSGGRMESAWRGASGMDAARGVRAMDGPCTPAAGARVKRGKSRAARPGCRGKRFCLLFRD